MRGRYERELSLVAEQTRDTENRLRAKPIFGGGGGDKTLKSCNIYGGNTLLPSSSNGIKWASTPITSSPVYDPQVATSFIDGVGKALLLDGSNVYILILNDSTCYHNSALVAEQPIKIDLDDYVQLNATNRAYRAKP